MSAIASALIPDTSHLTPGSLPPDRSAQLKTWVDYLQPITRRGVTIFAYANNHYSGHSPDTVKLFREYWDQKK